MNLNKVFILGNVTRDPEQRAMPSGQPVVNFGLATNRFYTDQAGQKKQDVEFHNVVCFGKLAEIAGRYLTRGSLVLIEGRIKTRNWQNQQGVKQYRTEIIAEGLQLGPRPSGSPQSNQGAYSRPAQPSTPQPVQQNQQDIPIIEENNLPPSSFVNQEAPTIEEKQDGEIDVSEIPF